MVTGTTPSSPASGDRPRLRADCARCAGLCCVAPGFTASADFAISKPAGTPCPNLDAGFRCGIHQELRPSGFPGCTVYDCFGAGQHVTQVVFGGRDWRSAPGEAAGMFAVFGVVRQLHEFLWYLDQASGLPLEAGLGARVREVRAEIDRWTGDSAAALEGLDPAALRGAVGGLLAEVSAVVRGSQTVRAGGTAGRTPKRSGLKPGADLRGASFRGADLVGVRLAGADLRSADLRGAYLIGADLAGADLRSADLLGADLRAADLAGADVSGVLFLTQMQLNAARGDARTKVPADVGRPPHWAG